MKWYDIKFKMPKHDIPVLCYGKLDDKICVFAGYWDNRWDDSWELQHWNCFPIDWCSCCQQPETTVTHWTEYPKPPI